MEKEPVKNQQFLMGLFGGIGAIAIVALIILGVAFYNMRGKEPTTNTNGTDQVQNNGNNQPTGNGPATAPITAEGINTFSAKAGATICKEDGKPVVYLFSTTWCPHCQWIKDTFDSTVDKYVKEGKIKAYHWEIDINDDLLTSAKETQVPFAANAIYQEFNPRGSIPTFVFGCKYFRVGNGYEQEQDLNAEKAEFEAVIADLIK